MQRYWQKLSSRVHDWVTHWLKKHILNHFHPLGIYFKILADKFAADKLINRMVVSF